MITASRYMLNRQEFMAVAGPTHGAYLQPFDWNNTNLKECTKYKIIEKYKREAFTPFPPSSLLIPFPPSSLL